MNDKFIADKVFRAINHSEEKLEKATYENCEFINCEFSEADLSAYSFIECTFKACNFSTTTLSNAIFRDVRFISSKLLGLQYDTCNQVFISFYFDKCLLNFSSFYNLTLKNIIFNNCELKDVDFANANLSNAQFNDCDLAGAIFDNTILEKADFRSSYNYSLDPEQNKIKKAKFSSAGIIGLLGKYDIFIE